jgi:protease-4
MKKLYKRINELWLKCRQWSNSNILGYLIVGIVKVITITVIGLLLFYGLFIVGPFRDIEEDSSVADTIPENCSVLGINLHGMLFTYIPFHADNDTSFNYDSVSSEEIIGKIKEANKDEKIKAIIIEVDSSGGIPAAGEEIAAAIKNSEKPVVAFIRGIGASSSYWAISNAEKIWASKNSSVGSIGITMSYLSNAERNKKDGLTYEKLSSGIYKDAGSLDVPLTKEERALFMRDVNIMFGNFIEAISANRNISVDKVKAIADGSTVLGEKAKELGLIDEIGSLVEVEKYLEKKLGETPEVCWQ